MLGKVLGFQTLMRRAIPHLDIDGDVCHHSLSLVGKFLNPFGGLIQSLCTDLRTEMKWNTDIRDYLKLICEILAVNASKLCTTSLAVNLRCC